MPLSDRIWQAKSLLHQRKAGLSTRYVNKWPNDVNKCGISERDLWSLVTGHWDCIAPGDQRPETRDLRSPDANDPN